VAEALGHHADPQTGGVLRQRGQVVGGLAGVQPVAPGDHVEHQRRVGHSARYRPDVVDRLLDRDAPV
jgi:hypothetical protein